MAYLWILILALIAGPLSPSPSKVLISYVPSKVNWQVKAMSTGQFIMWLMLLEHREIEIDVTGASAANNRIVGGSPTTIEKYPTIVQVESRSSVWSQFWAQNCGANILTSRFVLSAAHCFEAPFYEPRLRRIRAGSTYRNTGGLVVYVEREFNHPTYGQLGFDGDVSVVRLSSPLIFSPVIQQATIPTQGTVVPDGIPVVHAGWGHTVQGGSSSPVLLDVTIYTINNELCRQRYLTLPSPGIVTPNMICAGILDEGGKDACQGDSGGPLYFNNVVIGVVSWGHGCANATFPGISAAVGSYTNWILSVVQGY